MGRERFLNIEEPINIISPETLAADMCRVRMSLAFEDLLVIMKKERERGHIEESRC